MRWVSEIWLFNQKNKPEDVLNGQEIDKTAALIQIEAQKDRSSTMGPIRAIAEALNRTGWKMQSPFRLLNDLGQFIDIRQMSPEMVKDQIGKSHRRAS